MSKRHFRKTIDPWPRTKGLITIPYYDRPTWEEMCPVYAKAIAAKFKEQYPLGIVPIAKRGRGRTKKDPMAYLACDQMRIWYEHWTGQTIGRSRGIRGRYHGPYWETIRQMLDALGSQITPDAVIWDQMYAKKYADRKRQAAKKRYTPKRMMAARKPTRG
jgi:hypothetical protein